MSIFSGPYRTSNPRLRARKNGGRPSKQQKSHRCQGAAHCLLSFYLPLAWTGMNTDAFLMIIFSSFKVGVPSVGIGPSLGRPEPPINTTATINISIMRLYCSHSIWNMHRSHVVLYQRRHRFPGIGSWRSNTPVSERFPTSYSLGIFGKVKVLTIEKTKKTKIMLISSFINRYIFT